MPGVDCSPGQRGAAVGGVEQGQRDSQRHAGGGPDGWPLEPSPGNGPAVSSGISTPYSSIARVNIGEAEGYAVVLVAADEVARDWSCVHTTRAAYHVDRAFLCVTCASVVRVARNHQPGLVRVDHGLDAVPQVELGQDAADVGLHRGLG